MNRLAFRPSRYLTKGSALLGCFLGVILFASAAGASSYQLGSFFRQLSGSIVSVTHFNNLVQAITVQSSNQKRFVGGQFTRAGSTPVGRVARLNSDGSLDASFAPVGTGLNGTVNRVAFDSSGKAIVGGQFTSYNGTTRNYIVRLNTDGSLDTSFVPTGTGLAGGAVTAIAVDGDGKIVIGGFFTSYNGTTTNRIARLNTDGSLDTSFAPTGTGLNGSVSTLAIDADGKIVIGGFFTSYNGTTRNYVARLNNDGTLDTSFAQTGTGLNSSVYSLAIDGDGKIVVGGFFTSYNGTTTNRVARLNSDGTLDTSFAPTGTGLGGAVNSLVIDGDGKIVVGGLFTSYNGTTQNRIARLNVDGSLDTGFAPSSTGFSSTVNTLLIDGNGKILVSGNFWSYNGAATNYIVRLNTDGSLDSGFALAGLGLDNQARGLAVNASGKILTGGDFTVYGGVSQRYVARLNADGSLDTSFAPVGTGLNNSVSGLAVDGDGKVLVGGSFTSYNGTTRNRMARLNTDGSLDTSFAPVGTGFGGSVYSIAIDGDGKIVVGGFFTSYNGTTTNRVARVNTDGSLDTTFAPTGTGLNNTVNAVVIDGDGKIVVGGVFTSYNGTTANRIIRLNADGSLDTTFAPTGTGLNNTVNALAIDANGKIVVGGNFTSYDGTTRNYVARLNADGSLDTSFAPTGTGLNNYVYALGIARDGKIAVAGLFTSYNGSTRNYLTRLNADGSLDPSFASVGSGLGSFVYALAIDAVGRISPGGSFTTVNGRWAERFVMLHP